MGAMGLVAATDTMVCGKEVRLSCGRGAGAVKVLGAGIVPAAEPDSGG